MSPTFPIDLGGGVRAAFTCWRPDRKLNPQYDGIPDIDPIGLTIQHEDGCLSGIMFRLPHVAELMPGRDLWDVISLDPIHVEPSVLRSGAKNGTDHDHHGWIRGGRWVAC